MGQRGALDLPSLISKPAWDTDGQSRSLPSAQPALELATNNKSIQNIDVKTSTMYDAVAFTPCMYFLFALTTGPRSGQIPLQIIGISLWPKAV